MVFRSNYVKGDKVVFLENNKIKNGVVNDSHDGYVYMSSDIGYMCIPIHLVIDAKQLKEENIPFEIITLLFNLNHIFVNNCRTMKQTIRLLYERIGINQPLMNYTNKQCEFISRMDEYIYIIFDLFNDYFLQIFEYYHNESSTAEFVNYRNFLKDKKNK